MKILNKRDKRAAQFYKCNRKKHNTKILLKGRKNH